MTTWAGVTPSSAATRPTSGSASTRPRPSGDQDSVTTPSSRWSERSAVWVR